MLHTGRRGIRIPHSNQPQRYCSSCDKFEQPDEGGDKFCLISSVVRLPAVRRSARCDLEYEGLYGGVDEAPTCEARRWAYVDNLYFAQFLHTPCLSDGESAVAIELSLVDVA